MSANVQMTATVVGQVAPSNVPVLLSAVSSSATSATLTWSEVDVKAGWYRISSGQASGRYNKSTDVTGKSAQVTGLPTGVKSYFVIEFYENGGTFYGPSNELSVIVGGIAPLNPTYNKWIVTLNAEIALGVTPAQLLTWINLNVPIAD